MTLHVDDEMGRPAPAGGPRRQTCLIEREPVDDEGVS
jgi:hypothetical protein